MKKARGTCGTQSETTISTLPEFQEKIKGQKVYLKQ